MKVDFNLNDYLNKRIEKVTAVKQETYNALINVTKTIAELNIDEEKEILANKMKYFSAVGALSELEELKRLLNN